MLSSNPKLHFDTRIKSATRAFYGVQCAGLCTGGATPTHMFNVAIQPILTYGCTTLNFTRSSVKELDKVQAKLLKSALGLPKFCHNTPLLQELKVKKIDNLLQVQQLSLLRNALLNKSKARTFYLHMFKHGTSHTDKNSLSLPEATYRTFSYHAILIWNYLSKLICTNITLACFKKRSLVYLQTHLIPYRTVR